MPIHYYMVAMLFMMFDIEVVFLYPWAVLFKQLKLFGLIEMGIFLIILFIGFIYVWKKGALEWLDEAIALSQGVIKEAQESICHQTNTEVYNGALVVFNTLPRDRKSAVVLDTEKDIRISLEEGRKIPSQRIGDAIHFADDLPAFGCKVYEIAEGKNRLADIITKKVFTTQPEETLEQASRKMAQHHISALPVIDHTKKVVGLITSEDIAKLRGR